MDPRAGRTWRYQRGNLRRRALTALASGMIATALLGLCLPVCAQIPPADPAAALQAKRIELQPQLRTNAFGEPLYLSSREDDHQIEGDVFAEVRHPFAGVSATFKSASALCQLLFLHLNVRACEPSSSADGAVLTLSVGPKRALAPGVVHPMSYAMRVEAATAAYLRVTLRAAEGPLSTHDYRIVFEAVPIDASRSFVHLGYSYGYGLMAKIAMQVYLATAGRAKIGFTVIGQSDDSQPQYVRGERGSLERNVIRYYLAVLAYHGVHTGSPQAQMEARLRAWFALTERYAPQLHELDLDEYLHEKHDDLARAEAKAQ
jgi:hypothetical protein